MCVAQFREYCNSSHFKRDENGSFEKDLKDKNIELNGVYIHYSDCNSVYYVTDLKKMRQLAKTGNQYAINHLKKYEEE